MPKYSGNNYELRICRAKMEDKGEYVVKAENSYGAREEIAFLNVERKPLERKAELKLNGWHKLSIVFT